MAGRPHHCDSGTASIPTHFCDCPVHGVVFSWVPWYRAIWADKWSAVYAQCRLDSELCGLDVNSVRFAELSGAGRLSNKGDCALALECRPFWSNAIEACFTSDSRSYSVNVIHRVKGPPTCLCLKKWNMYEFFFVQLGVMKADKNKSYQTYFCCDKHI